MTEPRFAADMLRAFVERVERLQQEIQARVAAENYPELPTRLDRRPSQ
ncbi:MAG: hypothetical protein AB7R40_23860 [Nitrospiraceae bacterium]